MFVIVLAWKDSSLLPQPGKSIRTDAMPAFASASATPVRPPFSSLFPPWPCAITTRGTLTPSATLGITTVPLIVVERTEGISTSVDVNSYEGVIETRLSLPSHDTLYPNASAR